MQDAISLEALLAQLLLWDCIRMELSPEIEAKINWNAKRQGCRQPILRGG